jgi:hypothetical protein
MSKVSVRMKKTNRVAYLVMNYSPSSLRKQKEERESKSVLHMSLIELKKYIKC